MSDLQIQGEVVVSSEKAEAAFDRVGNAAQGMANDVAASASKAGQAVDKIGDGAGASAEKFTRAESRMSAAIKKATNELELLGKTASQRLEFNIADKGLDAAKFEPALKKLRELEAQSLQAQRAATGSLDKMGISAAQTAAALRGVPAQFTDIVTSLQGGQAPLTVFLQQGGQLKDMFGGAGAAARALGGYIVGLVNPFTVLAAAVAGVAMAYNQGSKEADAYRMALVTTGNAAGVTSGQLKSYAQDISGVVGTQGKAAEALATFASTGKVAGDVLKESAQAAVQWERVTGQAVSKTADQFAELAKDPLAATLKLNDGTNFLTESIYKQIKSLEEQGKTADAAAVAQRAYADALTGRSGEIERSLGTIERSWNRIKDAAKAGWDAILNIGRQSTTQDLLSDTRKRIAQLESQLGGGFGDTAGGAAIGRPSTAAQARIQAEIAGLKAKEAALQGVAYAAKVSAEEEAARAARVKAVADWDKEGAKYLSDRTKMERELTKARNEGAAAGKSQAEIEARLQQIRDSYNKKAGGGASAENKELRDRQRIYAELAGVSSTYYSELANYQKQRAAGVVTEEQYVQAVEKLISKQPFYTALVKEESDALKARVKAYEDEVKAQQKLLEQRQSAASQVEDSLRRAVEEEQAHALAAATGMTLAEALAQIALARAEDNYQKALGAEADAETMLALQREIEARKGLIEVMQQRGTREQFAESNREMTREWQRTVDQYGDVFRQGFADMLNNGKDGWKSFTRSLVTTFKTTVADAIYKMFAQPFVVNIVGNLMGLTGGGVNSAMQVATGGGGGLMGMASNASTAYSLLTGGATGAAMASSLGGAAISLGNLIGSSAVTSFGAGMAGATLAPGLMGPTTIGATGAMGAGAGLGSAMAAIPGWGWALAGIGALFGGDIISGLFGRKLKDSGIEGQFGGDTGFEGRQFEYYKGGLFRSNKTKYKDLDEEVRSSLGDQFIAMREGTVNMAEILGLGTDAIEGFTASVKISLKGLSAEEAQKKLQEEFDKIAESLASTALGTEEYTRKGETSVETLTRLSGSLTTVNSVLEHLNGTFFTAGLAAADMASSLVDLFGDANVFTQATGRYFQNFYSAAEQRSASRTQLERQLATVGVSMPNIDASDARAQYRAIAAAQDLTTESGRKTWAMLIQLSDAFSGLTQSIDEVIDKAFSDLQSATNRQLDGLQQQRNAVQESLSLITGIFDLVRSNARELYGEVADTASMQAEQGMEFVRNALTVARSTGVLPEQDALNEAIQAARSGISQAGYASQFDADFARLSLAGQLSELGDISGRQKTFEEKQLAALDAQSKALQDQLSYWEEQIAILRGTAVATWDIGEAVRNLSTALGAAKAPAIPVTPEAIPMPKPVPVEEPAPVQQTYSKDDLTARQILNVSGYGEFGPDYYGSLASWLKKQGISTDQAAYVLGMTRAELLERFASVGIPAFAAGGMHAGGLRVVGERGWELEATGPARIWNQQQISQALQGDSNAEVVAELRAVRAELAQLKSINAATASNTAGLPQMVDQFDNVTEGGNAIRSEAIA